MTLAGSAVSASAVPASERPALRSATKLPFVGHGDEHGNGDGGRGTRALNAAVANACNGGDPIVAPQWYFVGKKTEGSLRVAMTSFFEDDYASEWGDGTAIVDHWSGRVLACSGDAPTAQLSRSSRPVDVVGYLAYPVVHQEWESFDPELRILVDRDPAGAPANDQVANAEGITTLPFQQSVDTSLADDDGPDLHRWDCEPEMNPWRGSTIWYRYSPESTGPAPDIEVLPRTQWQGANVTAGIENLKSGIAEVLPDGGTRPVGTDDAADCANPPTLNAGTEYLIGVYYEWDRNFEAIAVTGGPISVSMNPR